MNNEGEHMKCREVQESLLDFLDGELEKGKALRVENHLASCHDCGRQRKAFEKSWEMLAELPDVEPDPLYKAKFWEKAREKDHRGIWNLLRRLPGMGAPALGALVSIIILLGGIWAWHTSPAPPWESQAYEPWNHNTMAHISVHVGCVKDPSFAGAAFFDDRALVKLPEYVRESEGEIYPELQIGTSSLAIMDGAYALVGSMAGEGE